MVAVQKRRQESHVVSVGNVCSWSSWSSNERDRCIWENSCNTCLMPHHLSCLKNLIKILLLWKPQHAKLTSVNEISPSFTVIVQGWGYEIPKVYIYEIWGLRNPIKYPVPCCTTKIYQSSLNYTLANYQPHYTSSVILFPYWYMHIEL